MDTPEWLSIVFLAGIFNCACGFFAGRKAERTFLVSNEKAYEARKAEFEARCRLPSFWDHFTP